MKPKSRLFKDEAFVTFERTGNWWHVLWRGADAEIRENIRCDTHARGLASFKEYCAKAQVEEKK